MKTFDDIVFYRNPYKDGWHGVLKLENYTLSVIAAKHAYSTPREYLQNVEDYSKFEVAVIGKEDFDTRKIFPFEFDDVFAYKSREEINDIIKTVTEHEKKESN